MKLITQEILLKDVFPEMVSKIQKDHNIQEPYLIRKFIEPSDVHFDEGEKSTIDYITTECVDRDGEIVRASGGDWTDFMAGPNGGPVLFGHDHRMLPNGKCLWIKQGINNKGHKGLIAKTVYHVDDTHPEAKKVWQYRKDGFPLSKSIGFIPLERIRYESGSKEYEQGIFSEYPKWLGIEYSDVPVPSCPEAVEIAVSKGLFTKDKAKDFTIVLEEIERKDIRIEEPKPEEIILNIDQKPDILDLILNVEEERQGDLLELVKTFIEVTKPGWDETDAEIRYRLKDPGLFRPDTFRTVPFKKDKPRVNSVMGKLKANSGKPDDPMVMQNLMFPKADDWTLTTAKEWLAAHGDLLKGVNFTVVNYAVLSWNEEKQAYTLPVETKIDCWIEDIVPVEEKSGRVLSSKNRETITTAVSAMASATTALNELLTATEPDTGNEGKSENENILENIPYPKEPANIDFKSGDILKDLEFTQHISPIIEFKAEDIQSMVQTQVDAAIKKSVIPAIAEAAKSAIRKTQGKID